jgi:uncharacterized protein (TIGR02001 family)
MLKNKTLVAALLVTALGVHSAHAAEPESEHKITGNIGFYSEYIFRGLTQTDGDPAIQGGLDYSHASGFYAGTWASNISWLKDFDAYSRGGSMEWDFYGGYRGAFGKSDFGYDLGLLYYWYPGDAASGFNEANTLEAYGALTWKWLSAKYSYSLDDKTFGVSDSRGTWYLDLTATVPVTEQLAVQAHWGKQEFQGDTLGVSNDSVASYEDWRLGVTYALPYNFTIGAYYSDTDMNNARKAFYTTPAGRFLGKDTFVVFLQKTF